MPVDSHLWPLFFGRLAATVVIVGVAAVTGNLHPPQGFPLRLALAAAVLDVGANIATLLALQSMMLSLAGVLMSLYPAATVVLADRGAARAGHPLAVAGDGAGTCRRGNDLAALASRCEQL